MAGGSFSPLRYVGLCLQVASVFFCMRGSSRRLVALPLSALFSLFWNAEFGIIGLLCQGLVLLTPQQRLPLWGRFAGRSRLFSARFCNRAMDENGLTKIMVAYTPKLRMKSLAVFVGIN